MTRTVYFGFKPQYITTNEIVNFLNDAGFHYFNICFPKVPPSESLRCEFVFIRFHYQGDALRLVETMNGKKFFGGTLKIEMKDGENEYDYGENLSGSDYVDSD